MNKSILLFFTIMLVALVGACSVSAADVGAVSDVDFNSIDDIVVIDEIDDSVDDEIVADDIPVEEDTIIDDNAPVEEDTIIDDNAPVEEEPAMDDNAPVEDEDVVDVTVSQNNDDVVAVNEMTNFEKIMTFLYHKEGYDDLDFYTVPFLFEDVATSYSAGHSAQNVGNEFGMTSEEVQYIVDNFVIRPISVDNFANSVYKLYGSKTLDEIASELDVSNHDVYDMVLQIKSGKFGKDYKGLFLRRDLINYNENHKEFVIGEF